MRLRSSPRGLSALSAAMAAVAGRGSGLRRERCLTPIGVPGGIAEGGQANGHSGCIGANAPSGIGDAGATFNQICGVALAFVGPSTGQIATATGPTIIGSTILAPITVSPGPVAVTSLP
jgi:hypothetical protein